MSVGLIVDSPEGRTVHLEFELSKKDVIKKHQAVSGQKVRYGLWAMVLLIVCSFFQILFVLFSEPLFGFPESSILSKLPLLFVIVFINAIVILRYIKRLNFPPLKVSLDFRDDYIHEQSGNTEYQKAYSCFDGVEEESGYIVIRHPGNAMVIPKRCLNGEQCRWLTEELPRRIQGASEISVPFYQQSFGKNEEKSIQYQWGEEDFEEMGRATFLLYKSGAALSPSENKSSKVVSARVSVRWIMSILAFIVILYSVLDMNLVGLPMIVFCVGFIVLNELAHVQQAAARRSQTQGLLGSKSGVLVSEEEVWIGQPQIVNRHRLSDIVNVYHSDYFVALQSNDRLLYLVPKRAIGGDEKVRLFLANVQGAITSVERLETGNPYQPPTL